jgi:hypothetical protein
MPSRPRFRWTAIPILAGVVLAVATAAGAEPPALDRGLRGDALTAEFDYFDGLRFDPAIPTPESRLGYKIGEHFTRHADMVAYFETLAAASDRVRVETYGQSTQRRSLHLVTISSRENLTHLDRILELNRELADPRRLGVARRDDILERNPAIVWFSYNVHGNEPSPTETAIQLAYTLAAATNSEVREILENVVVVIDPLLNPDGRARYVGWYQNALGAAALTNPDAAEHDEPWPGGRTNHYLFDLNRDWLWLIQPESRQRMRVYRRYMPQVHIDFHEQGYTQPFFLGAGDEPYHAHIPDETRRWVERYGRANAEVFDRNGLVYSTAERFDYLYPGYGKVLPVYHGAIGMLAEQAGHSRAGLAIDVHDAYTLTLGQRARNHFLLSMSNLETTSAFRRQQLERFHEFFDAPAFFDQEPNKAFTIDPGNDPALLQRVWELCSAHGIEIDVLEEASEIADLYDYRDGRLAGTLTLPAGTWIVSPNQPMGRLASTIFERQTHVVDKDTYDITSWSMPVAFGLDARYTTTEPNAPTRRLTSWSPPPAIVTGDGAVAVLVDADQHRFPMAVAAAMRHRLFARFAGSAFTIDDRSFGAGTLILHTTRNDAAALDAYLRDVGDAGLDAHRASAGMTTKGPVLGANANRRLVAPRAILLRGEPLSSNSYGQFWHMLDVESPFPYTPVNVDAFSSIDLDEYNLVIVPTTSGDLSGALGKATVDRLSAWVRRGGTIVAAGSAASWAGRSILDLKAPPNGNGTNGRTPEQRPELSELTWSQRRDRGVEDRVPGATVSATIDSTHPLAAGLPEWVGIIKRGTRVLPVADNGSVVARFDVDLVIGGVLSSRNIDRISGTPLVTHHDHGRGGVICFSDDVTFRGFQHGAKRILLNAICFGPSL